MNIDAYDTYVRTVEGNLLHFDILLPSCDGIKVSYYADECLLSIGKIPEKIATTAIPRLQRQKYESESVNTAISLSR